MRAFLYLSDDSSGRGIKIEFAFSQNNDLQGGSALIKFEKPVYAPQASGAVNITVQAFSAQWNESRDSPLVVTFEQTATVK